jgi:zinc transport system permease protein
MVTVSIVMAVLAVFLGLFSSLSWDLPAGPAIVMAAASLFFVSRLFFVR